MKSVVSVAVIGAGASGLCALRLLNDNPEHSSTTFKATAFEQTSQIGGTWFYTEHVGTDELGLPVHSSMYKNLRTNLPKEVMDFPDYPFPSNLPSFMSHEDVQKYLEDYATHFDLRKDINFQKNVTNVKPVADDNSCFGVKWEVTTVDGPNRVDKQTHIFDAVLVCNGHYSKPRMPTIPGLDVFEGPVIHSHDYREPSAYVGKTVLVLGAKNSGQDIGIDVADVAKKVYLSHNEERLSTPLPTNIEQKPGIKRCHKRLVEFLDESTSEVDAIILCTGYQYDFPFLDESIGINVEDGRVTHLFKHLLSVEFPSLGLVGILSAFLPFRVVYSQIKYYRTVLEGSSTLPSKKEMLEDEEEDFKEMTSHGFPQRYAHHAGLRQFRYFKELAELGHVDNMSPAFEKLFSETIMLRSENVTTYRDNNYVISSDQCDFKIVGHVI